MEDHRVISLKYVLQLEQGITNILKVHPFGELISKCLIAWGASCEVGDIISYKEPSPTNRIKICMKANVKWLFDGHQSLLKRCWEQNGISKFMYPDKTFDDFKESIVGNRAESEKLKNTLIDYITHFNFSAYEDMKSIKPTPKKPSLKPSIMIALRWIVLLPASVLGSYLVYIFFYWLNKSKDYPHTNFDNLWNYAIMFVSHVLMGGAFIGIGLYIAPAYRKVCSCVLFGIVCIFSGIALFANVLSGFSWISLISTICMIGGAGYVFYLGITEKNDK